MRYFVAYPTYAERRFAQETGSNKEGELSRDISVQNLHNIQTGRDCIRRTSDGS